MSKPAEATLGDMSFNRARVVSVRTSMFVLCVYHLFVHWVHKISRS